MRFTVSKSENFAQASVDLQKILAHKDGGIMSYLRGPNGKRYSYMANARQGWIHIRNEFTVDDLSADKQQQLMLWKMQYSG